MARRQTVQIVLRKQPQQARSAHVVASILEAAVQVLRREGAQRFTTARVAAAAGVSVGSLYQYFPNKATILFRLQADEWRQTTELLKGILSNRVLPPAARLRAVVHAFLRSECDEAAVRVALNDAAPLYRDAPEAREARASGKRAIDIFLREALPSASTVTRTSAGELIGATLSAVGKQFSASPRTDREVEAYAESLAEMLCAYLERLQNTARDERPRSAKRTVTGR